MLIVGRLKGVKISNNEYLPLRSLPYDRRPVWSTATTAIDSVSCLHELEPSCDFVD